jgi:hypothetical protein
VCQHYRAATIRLLKVCHEVECDGHHGSAAVLLFECQPFLQNGLAALPVVLALGPPEIVTRSCWELLLASKHFHKSMPQISEAIYYTHAAPAPGALSLLLLLLLCYYFLIGQFSDFFSCVPTISSSFNLWLCVNAVDDGHVFTAARFARRPSRVQACWSALC